MVNSASIRARRRGSNVPYTLGDLYEISVFAGTEKRRQGMINFHSSIPQLPIKGGSGGGVQGPLSIGRSERGGNES